MDLKRAFGKALKQVRTHRGLSQEAFSVISSRTYLSTLERGVKSPTLDKIEVIAGKMEVHPVTLLVMTYLQDNKSESLDDFLKMIESEVIELIEDEE
ncbi:MAG: helix-turn-helix transcriptional regulator [Gammaproteobacteria bacterium]|nr:helix-turn-helix transcriptional regulator [Gammaproteobacteria bacterium]